MTKKSTYFISDLHLDPTHPHLFKFFHDFIDDIKKQADALYILGDLFEFWIGDDILDLPIGKPYLSIINSLKSLSDLGIKLYFIQGNRDFLIGEKFMNCIGGKLLPDQEVIELYGTPTLIMHGDTLCTDDKAYQRLRTILRLRIVQKLYLLLSPENRARKAGIARKKSQKKTKQKESMILDVNQDEVEKQVKWGVYFDAAQQSSLLIHGHTHRPAVHEFKLDGKQIKRIVLGDWRDKACFLRVDKAGFDNVF